ncbi:secretory phospholipase A2 receptor-like [Pangasianodon hypophthalmus]|uniref:secretory phospholipase A2 receptor-like n=1 Tax=Pangasianodon hypophthalmus TaxID=310915 RepID=UPI0023075C71|nr:secretory phospholipase A2 receptor-like [Pangasianodon hypophthalmus]
MKLNLFLLCLTGIVPITLSTVAHKYHLITTPMTWSAAQNYCREKYDDLAAIQSVTDWLRISAEALRKFMIFPAWIGMYNNVDSWRWSFNDLPLKNITLRKWYFSEPSNGKEACGAIDFNGYWFDYPCTNLKSFICYDSRLSGGARFIPYLLPLLDWSGAQAYCRTFHTDLATASNSIENSELKNKVLFLTSSWFGLFRDTWTWLDGSIASSIPWGLFQPDNLFGAQNCATYAVGMISDETCSSEYAFFCHSTPPVRKQQIMRLQVKSDGSVFDPDVQASILEQIKEKLEENGMLENTTVAWKVQPEGNIFYKKKNNDL